MTSAKHILEFSTKRRFVFQGKTDFKIFRTYPKNMGVAEIEQFCGLARKKNGSILFKKTYSAVFLTPPGCKRADCRQPRFLG